MPRSVYIKAGGCDCPVEPGRKGPCPCGGGSSATWQTPNGVLELVERKAWYEGEDDGFSYEFRLAGKYGIKVVASVDSFSSGSTVHIDVTTRAPFPIGTGEFTYDAKLPVGVAAVRRVLSLVQKDFPGAARIRSYRVTGIKKGRTAQIALAEAEQMSAHQFTRMLVALWTRKLKPRDVSAGGCDCPTAPGRSGPCPCDGDPASISNTKYLGEDTEWDDLKFNRQRVWRRAIRKALSEGRMTPERARELGYAFSGHEEDFGSKPKWQPLPQELYHVTTAKDAVLTGGLKSRVELAMDRAQGLGGGDDESISFTTDRATAEGIYHTMEEARKVASGEVTLRNLVDAAEKGTGAQRSFLKDFVRLQYKSDWEGGELPEKLRFEMGGEKIVYRSLALTEAKLPAGARFVGNTWLGGDGLLRGNTYVLPATATEALDTRWSGYQMWLASRQIAGGYDNPLFFGTDPSLLGKVKSDQIAIVKAAPKPGAQGYPMSSLAEWRTHTGNAVKITDAFVPTKTTMHFASPFVLNADVALADDIALTQRNISSYFGQVRARVKSSTIQRAVARGNGIQDALRGSLANARLAGYKAGAGLGDAVRSAEYGPKVRSWAGSRAAKAQTKIRSTTETLLYSNSPYALSGERAQMIASYELGRAYFAGVKDALRRTKKKLRMLKFWKTSPVESCEACLEAEAQGGISLDGVFVNGFAFPRAHQHCMCFIVVEVG